MVSRFQVSSFKLALLLGLALAGPAGAQSVGGPGQPLVPLGYCQLTSIDTAAKLSACAGGIPAGATSALIVAEAQAIRWRDDGTNPTASVGMTAAVGAPFYYSGTLSAFAVISATSGAKLDVSFYRQ